MFGFLVIFGSSAGTWENEELAFPCADSLSVSDNSSVRVASGSETADSYKYRNCVFEKKAHAV